ncbi:MAG: hypothetical protein AAF495_28620 [Pseudomonadota bacterium]
MSERERRGEKTAALALLGAVLFCEPLLDGFDADAELLLFGIPSLYLYLFVAWGVLIALLALVLKRKDGADPVPDARDPDRREGG